MGRDDDGSSLTVAGAESRPPTLDDLVRLCDALNRAGAEYIVIGGMAIIQLGFVRATEDIDLLIDASAENVERVKTAMMELPDRAARDVEAGDVEKYVVVRVADEIVVDLMKSACGVDYAAAWAEVEDVVIQGVRIPFAGARLLWRLKQTMRAKDELDRFFLKLRLDQES